MTWNNHGSHAITRLRKIKKYFETKWSLFGIILTKVRNSFETKCSQSGTHGKTTPWFAPGTAPVYGACGTLGGWGLFHFRTPNKLGRPQIYSELLQIYFTQIYLEVSQYMSRWPEGCHQDGKGHFGDCCSGNCDGFALQRIFCIFQFSPRFALGKNAEEYDWPGEIPVTEWLAGSFQVSLRIGDCARWTLNTITTNQHT